MMVATDEIRVTEFAHHRNGVGGEGFTVVLFEWDDPDYRKRPRRMVATLFWDENENGWLVPDFNGRCAVLDRDLLAVGGIAMGVNSWRGDHFESALREEVLRRMDQQR